MMSRSVQPKCEPLRLLIYDRTCLGARSRPGLSHAWRAGAWLYRRRGLLDHARGAASFAEALQFLAEVSPERSIAVIQFWGHGKWGDVRIDREALDARALAPSHELNPWLRAIRARFTPDALWWFRTCETFGAEVGQRFARSWTDFFGTRAAGHTYVIGYWQSGLHALGAGCTPDWSPEESLLEGSARSPERARVSRSDEPNTITCLRGTLPDFCAARPLTQGVPV